MKLSIEISMYPLQDDYLNKIDAFLLALNKAADKVEIRTSNMSTRLFGDFSDVTFLLNAAMEHSMREHGKLVFVCKYLSGDARDLVDYD